MKKMEALWYFVMHITPLLVIGGVYFQMPILFLGIFAGSLVILGILDIVIPRDNHFSYEEVIATPENDGRLAPWIYEIATISYFIAYIIAIGMSLYAIQFGQSFLSWFFYCIPLGVSSGKTLNLCHEYFHKNNRVEKCIARFFLSLLLYNYLEYEHLHSHHNDEITCTEQDVGTARLNEGVYAFAWRAYSDSFKKSFSIQSDILANQGNRFFNVFRNTLLRWSLCSIAIYVSVGIFIGTAALALLLTQTFIALLLFGSVTYGQHYGLMRRVNSNNTLESFSFMNIFASDHFISSREFINLTHHGHHHLFQLCRYPHLKVIRMGPKLPYGYTTMAIIALIPSLWFKIMNPVVEEVFKQRDILEKEGKL